MWQLYLGMVVFVVCTHGRCYALENNSSDKTKKVLSTLSLSKLLNLKLDSSSFFQHTVKMAPNYTRVITSSEWSNLGLRSLKDIIDSSVPGMQMTQHFGLVL